MPPDLREAYESFEAVLGELEPAKATLTEVMPTTRLPGRALPDALADFEAGLARAAALMPGWRIVRTESVWDSCESGIRTALERAAAFREGAPELGGFEGLVWAVGELLAPLEPFEDAEAVFRSRRGGG